VDLRENPPVAQGGVPPCAATILKSQIRQNENQPPANRPCLVAREYIMVEAMKHVENRWGLEMIDWHRPQHVNE
jgi:hypothetical protein